MIKIQRFNGDDNYKSIKINNIPRIVWYLITEISQFLHSLVYYKFQTNFSYVEFFELEEYTLSLLISYYFSIQFPQSITELNIFSILMYSSQFVLFY